MAAFKAASFRMESGIWFFTKRFGLVAVAGLVVVVVPAAVETCRRLWSVVFCSARSMFGGMSSCGRTQIQPVPLWPSEAVDLHRHLNRKNKKKKKQLQILALKNRLITKTSPFYIKLHYIPRSPRNWKV